MNLFNIEEIEALRKAKILEDNRTRDDAFLREIKNVEKRSEEVACIMKNELIKDGTCLIEQFSHCENMFASWFTFYGKHKETFSETVWNIINKELEKLKIYYGVTHFVQTHNHYTRIVSISF